jgi:methyl-accepting chemotaxis protein
MKNSTLLTGSLLLSLILLLLLAFGLQQLSASQTQLNLLEQQHFQAYRVAEELRHSSDDLTRLARSYAQTGDARYQAAFQRILDIRSGQHARPTDYHLAYWDLVLAGSAAPSDDGAKVPLLTLLKRTGVKDEELHLLKDAETASDSLAKIESRAIAASTGARTERARTMTELYSSQYEWAKAQIMKNYNGFVSALDQRYQREAGITGQRLAMIVRLLWLDTALLALSLAGAWLLHRRRPS